MTVAMKIKFNEYNKNNISKLKYVWNINLRHTGDRPRTRLIEVDEYNNIAPNQGRSLQLSGYIVKRYILLNVVCRHIPFRLRVQQDIFVDQFIVIRIIYIISDLTRDRFASF